jgi:formamidopyrimidine-DNA glycosylase
MPELPEIETLSQQLQTVTQSIITEISFANVKLRYNLEPSLHNAEYKKIIKISRRAKYLILHLSEGFLIVHLGMSGKLLLLKADAVLKKHDHVTIHLNDGHILRYNDPRRFGCVIYRDDLSCLQNLAIEPFDSNFNSEYLYKELQKKSTNIKTCILSGSIVVGVGNIYVSESLFLSRIHPLRPGNSISLSECESLIKSIHQTLTLAIKNKGSSLKDFVNIYSEHGNATNNLLVYAKSGLQCSNNCGNNIKSLRISGRNTFYCNKCQL